MFLALSFLSQKSHNLQSVIKSLNAGFKKDSFNNFCDHSKYFNGHSKNLASHSSFLLCQALISSANSCITFLVASICSCLRLFSRIF
jgi:hypothetical protein